MRHQRGRSHGSLMDHLGSGAVRVRIRQSLSQPAWRSLGASPERQLAASPPSDHQAGASIVGPARGDHRLAQVLVARGPRPSSAARAPTLSSCSWPGGWPRRLLACWASDGVVLELYDPADEIPRGAAIVEFVGDGTYELRAWVATMDLSGRGAAGRLVERRRRRAATKRWTPRRRLRRRCRPATARSPTRRGLPHLGHRARRAVGVGRPTSLTGLATWYGWTRTSDGPHGSEGGVGLPNPRALGGH